MIRCQISRLYTATKVKTKNILSRLPFPFGDLIIIGLVLLVSVILLITMRFSPQTGGIPTAQIKINGIITAEIPLNIDTIYSTEHLSLEVKNGKIWVSDADCPDQTCKHQGEISSTGEVIVCLPNRTTITIIQNNEIDSIAW